jgi:hypothetical protein
MYIALIVIPNFATWLGKHGLDREQESHLLRLEDATLRIYERDAIAVENETRPQFCRRQVIVHLTQPSDVLEGCHAHAGVSVLISRRSQIFIAF